MKALPALAALSLVSWSGPTSALAADAAASANVQVRLVSEVAAIQPGKAFSVALQITMAPGWHTYWKNPGDSGMPTRVVWSLPKGFKASELKWPVPVRAVDAGLALYGYEREVTLLTEITPGAALTKGPHTVSAKVTWLECKDICIPGKATLEVVLPSAGGAAPPPADNPAKPLFAAARSALPGRARAATFSHAVEGDRLILKVDGTSAGFGKPLEFFPETAGLIEAAAPQLVTQAARGGWTISMKRAQNAPEAADLRGVLVAAAGTRRMAYDISAEKPRPSIH